MYSSTPYPTTPHGSAKRECQITSGQFFFLLSATLPPSIHSSFFHFSTFPPLLHLYHTHRRHISYPSQVSRSWRQAGHYLALIIGSFRREISIPCLWFSLECLQFQVHILGLGLQKGSAPLRICHEGHKSGSVESQISQTECMHVMESTFLSSKNYNKLNPY